MRQKLTLIVLLFFSAMSIFAQKFISRLKPQLIGVHLTLVDYNSPTLIKKTSLKEVLSRGDIFNPGKQSSAFGISYWKGLTNNIDFSGKFNGIFYDYKAHNNPGTQYSNEFGAELEGSLNFRPITDAHFFTPFITAGIGAGHYTSQFGAYVPIGLSWQFNFKSKVYIFLQNQFRFSLSTDVFPNNLLHSIGVAVNISHKKSTTAVPVLPVEQVSDSDNDGIIDSLDACPEQAGIASLNGCPDKDGDGITDINDKCPNIKGVTKYLGCPIPDTDKDGINDEEDKCPNIAGVARFQGCPIPDTDKDGVNDENDKCPNETGPASNFGCPEIKQEVIEKINLAAKNIFFATGSEILLAKSYTSLNNVVQVLTDQLSLKVMIEGYTDSTGSAAKNQLLSENRAASVAVYLISKGIDPSRINYKGYGADKPIANNKTAAGRAKNRRVEIKLRNY